MPMTGRVIPLTLAPGCRGARFGNPARGVRQFDLADRTLEPLVGGDLPPDPDQPDQHENARRVVDGLPLELRVRPWPAGGRERQREADHADGHPDDRARIDPLVLLAERPWARYERVAHAPAQVRRNH